MALEVANLCLHIDEDLDTLRADWEKFIAGDIVYLEGGYLDSDEWSMEADGNATVVKHETPIISLWVEVPTAVIKAELRRILDETAAEN